MKRIAVGPVISVAGALLLIVSLFLDWYEPGINAWKAFEVLDLVLMGLGIAVIAASLDRLGAGLKGAPDLERAILPLAIATFVIVISQILNHPPLGIGRGEEVGIWLAAGGAVMMVAGAVSAVARISVAVQPREPSPEPAPKAEPAPAAKPASSDEDPTERISGNVD